MQPYYYILLAIALVIVVLILRFLRLKKKNTPVRLFSQALKNENNGHFEEAVITYGYALAEVKKIRFHKELESKIIEKLKVLNMMIEYDKNCVS